MNIPNFFLLGVSKAGTTSLHHYLSQHRDVVMSEPKEPLFFRAEYERGLNYYRSAYFGHFRGQAVAGDGAPQNLYLPYVARRIHASVPNAHLAVVCRDPVERAIAAYWHSASRGIETRSFEEAIARNIRRLDSGLRFETEQEAARYAELALKGYRHLVLEFGFYVEPGYYAEHIERYWALFGKERLKILFFEDLQRDATQVVNELLAFLGLPPTKLHDMKVQNAATSEAAASVYGLLGRLPGVSLISPKFRRQLKRTVGSVLGGGKPTKPKIAEESLRQLAAHFRPHNLRLAQITGRDLSHWGSQVNRDAPAGD
jgi:hypothetical protein